MEKPHYRSQRAGEWSLIWAHDSRPIYRALTYIAAPLLGPHQPRYIGLTLYIDFLAWRQRIISLVCFAKMPSIRGLRWCWYSTEKYLPDSHPPFVYVVILSISSIWSIGETNPSTKTSKILFSMVMPTFGKSCQRPWLHGLKNQS